MGFYTAWVVNDQAVTLQDGEGAEEDSLPRQSQHLSAVLGECSHNFQRRDPAHPNTFVCLDELAGMIGDIPQHRPDDANSAGVLLEEGILLAWSSGSAVSSPARRSER